MNKPRTLRVLVVDDSAYARQTITQILNQIDGVEVVGKAGDGAEAIPKVMKLSPDLITCDIEMPNMDGFEFLRWLMATRPTPMIMVSSLSAADAAFRALELGAIDFIRKPSRGPSPELKSIRREVERAIEELPDLVLHPGLRVRPPSPGHQPSRPWRLASPNPPRRPRCPHPSRFARRVGPPELVVVGASTGGPAAVEKILHPIPSTFPCPILIVQHMPPGFTRLFAERLDRVCKLTIREAETGLRLEPGHAYICPGGFHSILDNAGHIAAIAADPEDRYVPSVDRTMTSAAHIHGNAVLGILLTGMGDDGKQGMAAIDERRGLTVAESEETALVYGMPERAVSAGVVESGATGGRHSESPAGDCGSTTMTLPTQLRRPEITLRPGRGGSLGSHRRMAAKRYTLALPNPTAQEAFHE